MFHINVFIDHLRRERRLSAHTLLAYEQDLIQFATFASEKYALASVSEAGHLHIRTWVVSLMDAGLSAGSITRKLSCLKTYFKYLSRSGLIVANPMRKVIAPRVGKRLPAFVPEPHLELLFTRMQFPDTLAGKCHRALLELLYGTGMRRGEATALRPADIDWQRMSVKVRGKGGKERIAPVGAYLLPILDEYLECRRKALPHLGDSDPLFINAQGKALSPESAYYAVRKYLRMATNVEPKGPHVLRHSFATHLSNRGADLDAIKELLGHKSLAATQVYTHNQIERLKEVYRQAHPKGSQEQEDKVEREK